MGVVNTKSLAVTNSDSDSPRLATPGYLAGARPQMSMGTVEIAAADSDTSVYRMVRLPSNAVIYRIEILNDVITGGTSYDLGFYQINDNGGAVVDADIYATAIDMTVARSLPFDASFEVLDIANIEKRVWEVLGLSADPQRLYDLCFTANTVGTGAGTISMRVMWVA